MNKLRLVLVLVVFTVLVPQTTNACKFTPGPWQQTVEKHAIAAMVGQHKHLTWIRDRNRNFIDDEIESRFRSGEVVNIIVDLNECYSPGQIRELLDRFGKIRHVGKLITFVMVDDVHVDDLPKIAALKEVAMIEWQRPLQIINDVSNRAIQAAGSNTYSPNTARDAGFDGSGVTVAIVDTGIDEAHEAFAGKFVAGFNALNASDPGDGSTHPGDDHGHGTHVASITLGARVTGRTCRSPNDGSTGDCGGVAPASKFVVIKVCNSSGLCPWMQQGLDWLGTNAARFHVRAANMSIGGCTDDDGTDALAQQVNYIVALGVAFAVAHGNASNCGVMPGTKLTGSPGSASFAITVAGTNDQGTVSRTDDTIYSGFLTGARKDFNLVSPNLLALKPDISAPGENIFAAQKGTTSGYVSDSGTSMASPHVAGAAALLIQARPAIDPGSLKDLLKRSADTSKNTATFAAVDPVWNSSFGSGMLNLWPAVNTAAASDVKFPNCVGPPATPGGLCALTAPMPPWDNTADISTAGPPKVGVPNTITANVRNEGPAPATVLVNFGVYVFAVGNNQFIHVGTVQVTIPPGQTVAVSQPWTPSSSNHQCVQVSIQYAFDTNYTNNLTQRNLAVAPSVYEVRVENPFMVSARFELRPKSDREGWACKTGEMAFTLDPFEDCPRKVRVTFDAPANAEPGQHANCDMAVYATPRGAAQPVLIGGVTMQTFVPQPCRLVGTVVNEKGEAIAGVRVTFTRQGSATGKRTGPSGQRAIDTVSEKDGLFTAVLPPLLVYTVLLEKEGVGRGELSMRPECGAGSVKFVLGRAGARLSEVARGSLEPE